MKSSGLCGNSAFFAMAVLLADLALASAIAHARPGQGLSGPPTNPSYLREMPSADRVLREVQGSDPIDTAARQSGAFEQLRKVIYDLALAQRRDRNHATPDEQRIAEAYAAASARTWQLVQKALAQNRPKMFELSGYSSDPRFLSELMEKFFSPGFRTLYANANATFAARHADFEKQQQQQMEQARTQASQQVHANAQPGGIPPTSDPGTLAARRCAESGRSLTDCLAVAFKAGLGGLAPSLAPKAQSPGLVLSGLYHGADISLSFGASTNGSQSGAAGLKCGKLENESYGYKLATTSHGLVVQIASRPPLELALRSDSTWAGPGRLEMQGKVIAGYGPPHAVSFRTNDPPQLVADSTFSPPSGSYDSGGYHYESQPSFTPSYHYETRSQSGSKMVRDPIYKPATDRCDCSVLSPSKGPMAEGRNGMSLVEGVLLPVQAAAGTRQFTTPQGVRLLGSYAGRGGLGIEFRLDSATVNCGEIGLADAYVVTINGNQVVVELQNGPSPFTMILRPDGSLAPAATGSVTMAGRVMTGTNGSGGITYASKKATCTLGVLAPHSGN